MDWLNRARSRFADDDHRDHGRGLSLRRGAVVQCPLWSRWPNHGPVGALAAAGYGAWGALVPGGDASHGGDSRARCGGPGKILHETREGEMAALGEVPFGCYYGSVDSTPLFVMLAGAYYERTGDLAFVNALWPNVVQALSWIDNYGDVDGDGFVEYARQTPHGLANQGWKDSHDSVFHADGSQVEGPVALCEVQGYVYAAKRRASELARVLGHTDQAEALAQQAQALQTRFEDQFWCEDLGTYALALDGDKQPCRVRTSNAGHALFTGIASPDRAQRVAETLLTADGFAGWGIRYRGRVGIRLQSDGVSQRLDLAT